MMRFVAVNKDAIHVKDHCTDSHKHKLVQELDERDVLLLTSQLMSRSVHA